MLLLFLFFILKRLYHFLILCLTGNVSGLYVVFPLIMDIFGNGFIRKRWTKIGVNSGFGYQLWKDLNMEYLTKSFIHGFQQPYVDIWIMKTFVSVCLLILFVKLRAFCLRQVPFPLNLHVSVMLADFIQIKSFGNLMVDRINTEVRCDVQTTSFSIVTVG